MLRPVYKLILKILGWKIVGSFPSDLKKYVVAVAPHTSNWDFPLGIAVRSVLGMQKSKFLGKSQLFKPPFGWMFRSLGGIPVDRSKSHDLVEQVVQHFNDHEELILALAPEGTRKKVKKLRTGFYFIARKAGVPIIPTGFDFEKREVIIGKPFYPSENIEHDIDEIISFYRKIKGRNPELGID